MAKSWDLQSLMPWRIDRSRAKPLKYGSLRRAGRHGWPMPTEAWQAGIPEFQAEGWSLIFLALFFFPIALYCLILGMINRRPHPVMVSGSWDFFGLLLAASGLLLFGGPTVL